MNRNRLHEERHTCSQKTHRKTYLKKVERYKYRTEQTDRCTSTNMLVASLDLSDVVENYKSITPYYEMTATD